MRKRIPWKRIAALIVLALPLAVAYIFWPESVNLDHLADAGVPLFMQRQLKPVWLDEADIRANLEREYRPGE